MLFVTLLLYGWPVPRLSEELYLPLVKRVADSSYLRGDWTFAGDFSEHWLFDHLFAPVANVDVDLGVRLARAARLLAVARVPPHPARHPVRALGLAGRVRDHVLAAHNQALMGSEWILGTFEAKTVAYVCFLGALLAVTYKRIPLALALLGLTVSFHPAVGLWSAWATGIALLALPETRRATLRWCWLALLLAIPGIVGAFAAIGESTAAMQRFVVLEAIPYHTDPFFSGKTLVGAQVVLHVVILRRDVRVQPLVVRAVAPRSDPTVLRGRSRSPRPCRSSSRFPPGRSTSGTSSGSCRCGRSR